MVAPSFVLLVCWNEVSFALERSVNEFGTGVTTEFPSLRFLEQLKVWFVPTVSLDS